MNSLPKAGRRIVWTPLVGEAPHARPARSVSPLDRHSDAAAALIRPAQDPDTMRLNPGCGTAGLLTAAVAVLMLSSGALTADSEDHVFILLLLVGGSVLATIGLVRRLLRLVL